MPGNKGSCAGSASGFGFATCARISAVDGGGGGGGALRTAARISCGAGVKMRSSASSGASGSGISFGDEDRADVSTLPILIGNGRRDNAGPSATKCPRCRSRNISACLRSMPRRSAARAISISRNVRPMRKFEASAATFLASFASRCVAITPARPRFRPRHMRLVIAPSDSLRASSDTSPAAAGAKSCASSTTTSIGYQ